MSNRTTRAARRAGILAMVDHLLRDAALPANPYPRGQARNVYWQWGADQARALAAPVLEPKR